MEAMERRMRHHGILQSLVKSETIPKSTIFAIFDLLYLDHNIPTIENLVTNIQY